ncbi:MAG: 4'-phosphopantetheinyl transferase superfamily protein [Propionibacteriaceae bacterium]|nr:4'-phosphopantetheinyl transferase superfamily protein [Propionibacteriaceae bacterium]
MSSSWVVAGVPVVYCATRVPVGLDSLWPSEVEVVRTASAKRQREYAGVRWCAREALVELGVGPAAVLNDSAGCPLWPEGIVGSMTHCDGFQAAALAWEKDITALGIDAEPTQGLPPGVLDRISSTAEREVVSSLFATDREIPWDRLLFCVKESIFKAWYPVARVGLGFLDVEVRLSPSFTAHIEFHHEVPAGLGPWNCTWSVNDTILLATTWCA